MDGTMLKAEMHSHCNDDPWDTFIHYSAEDLMERVAANGFDVLSITLHNKLYFPERYKRKAEELGLLLIPGAELNVEGRDVLVYNLTGEEARSIRRLRDLKKFNREDTLIVAPHPYLPFCGSLGKQLDKYRDAFDAVEHTYFHTTWMDRWNRKVREKAKQWNKPLVGNSDIHWFWQIGLTYSLIDAKKKVEDVIRAIKDARVDYVSTPLDRAQFFKFCRYFAIEKVPFLPRPVYG